MPSGKAHRKLATATAPLVVLGAWTVSNFAFDFETWASIAIVTGGYLMNPAILSPDCDLVHSDPSDKWGKLEPLLWGYQLLIHKGGGRNPLSHWPPLSSILRMFYLWVMTFITFLFGVSLVNLVWYGLSFQVLIPFAIAEWFSWWCAVIASPWWWRALWGVALGDLVHLVADISYSFMRK